MTYKESDTVIGYSGLDVFEECYGYDENACFIGNTRATARRFMEDSLMSSGDFRIDAVTISEIMNDFGLSCGEFAMESEAFRRFMGVAAANGIRFEATPFDGDESLMVVQVEGTRCPDEASGDWGSGLYSDDGTRIEPMLVPKPSLCVTCKKDGAGGEEDMLCILNRNDQQGESGEFECGAYEPKT